MKDMKTVKYTPIRRTFPKVFRYERDGHDYFLVDGRSRKWGLNIRRNFNNQKDSLDYSRELENQILERGKNVSNDVVYQTKDIEKLVKRLEPFGKTLNDSVAFFVRHLQEEIQKSIVPPIGDLCLKWYEEKTKNTLEPLRNRTRVEYKSYFNFITRTLGSLKPTEVTKKHIRDLLEQVNGKELTRKKYLQYLKNFFNWCVEENYITVNPTHGVKIKIPKREIVIYSPDEVEKILRLCEEKYPSLLGYYCLCVFGGLRPSESERVKWEDLHFEGKEVSVNRESKTGGRRFVLKDTDTLWIWLNHIKTLRPNEPLNPLVNHQGLQKKFRTDLGLPWTQDVLRHTFGTNYYNLHRDLNQVSHDMGNSNEVCKKHYVREVKRTDRDKFWGLRPKT
jgi:integrase